MAYTISYPEGSEETNIIGTQYLRINYFDTGSQEYLRTRLGNATSITIASPVGNITTPTQNIDNIFGITGGPTSFVSLEASYLGGSSGSVYITTITTPKKSIQSYYPNINTTLKTTSSNTEDYNRAGDYWIPCLMNRDFERIGATGTLVENSPQWNTPFIYWGLRGNIKGSEGNQDIYHGNNDRSVRIPFSSSDANSGDATGAWKSSADSDPSGSTYGWHPQFVYPSPLKVKFTASIESFAAADSDMTSSLYLVAQTDEVGNNNHLALKAGSSYGPESAKTPSFQFNISSPIQISASVGTSQEVEFELLLTQSYSRIVDTIMGVPYSTRTAYSRGSLSGQRLITEGSFTNGWYLCLYTDSTHSSADNTIHKGGTSPYFISGGKCEADVRFIFREPTAFYQDPPYTGDFDFSSNPYKAGDVFKSPRGNIAISLSGSNKSYMVIYESQSFSPDPVDISDQDTLNANLLLSSSMYIDGDGNPIAGGNPLTTNWNWTTKIPSIINTQSAGYEQLINDEAIILIEPKDADGNYVNNNFNPTIGNAHQNILSQKYYRAEYDNNTVVASNITSIEIGNAERAEVEDSSYSSNSWIRSRYKGTRVSSNDINTNN